MKPLLKVSTILLLLTFFSCSSVKVVTDQDKTVDFSKYETYSFLGWKDESDANLNDFDKKRIREAFLKEFQSRNLSYVEEDGDMAVSLFIVLNPKTSVTAYSNYYGSGGYGYRRYGGGWGYGHATTTYTENDYIEGTLVMDVFDTSTKEQIWQGVARGTVTENPDKRETSIPKGISALMKKFPVPVSE